MKTVLDEAIQHTPRGRQFLRLLIIMVLKKEWSNDKRMIILSQCFAKLFDEILSSSQKLPYKKLWLLKISRAKF